MRDYLKANHLALLGLLLGAYGALKGVHIPVLEFLSNWWIALMGLTMILIDVVPKIINSRRERRRFEQLLLDHIASDALNHARLLAEIQHIQRHLGLPVAPLEEVLRSDGQALSKSISSFR